MTTGSDGLLIPKRNKNQLFPSPTAMIGTRIHVTGIVQGVGFRPFIYKLAQQQNLTGWVRNSSAGVDIEIYGDTTKINLFIQSLNTEFPPLARIDSVEFHQIPFTPSTTFEIIGSKEVLDAFQPISPDICICDDCLRELFDPVDRRYRYPFINCTNCGPRLTIIEGIPYDRPNTTMKDFQMCPECKSEYTNPADRRFHAQPVACPVCGPQVWLESASIKGGDNNHVISTGDAAIHSAQKLLKMGKIVAIKGLGGFHLACDATNPKAVKELRKRKLRVDKPFALMMPDIAAIERDCVITDNDRELLESRERPIVIVPRRENSSIANDVTPNQNTLGVMLPYTPLHYLIFAPPHNKKSSLGYLRSWHMPPLVMTSGNISEEPISIHNDEAIDRLASLADAFLMHDRMIRTRCDDSVMRTFRGVTIPLRRSRGYTPYPVYLNKEAPQILAAGGELKNTFCITRGRYAFLSHHIGDMENVETYDSFVDSVSHYESLFRITPEAICYDLHPNYLATRYALERGKKEGLPVIGIQHHHAHITSCMAENAIRNDLPIIGVAFDGTGYGEDGAIWGGEFLLVNYQNYSRVAHLKYIPLPGGDTAIRKPARIALAYLWANGFEWEPEFRPVSALCAEERTIIRSQLEQKINTPPTSSMGRFFDAVASLSGVRQQVNYEAQAAIEYEALADPDEKSEYNLVIEKTGISKNPGYLVDQSVLIEELIRDVHDDVPIPTISARFHNGIAKMVRNVCTLMRGDFGTNKVVLSGGVWQNLTLLHRTYDLLVSDNFDVYVHKLIPMNDGGLALGQAVIAMERMEM